MDKVKSLWIFACAFVVFILGFALAWNVKPAETNEQAIQNLKGIAVDIDGDANPDYFVFVENASLMVDSTNGTVDLKVKGSVHDLLPLEK